jgi:predicted site-specific integrase-resolvase
MREYQPLNKKADLTRKIETLETFCLAQGIKVDQVFSDIASGINLVFGGQVEKVFISYKDRLSRVGFSLFKHLFLKFGTEIVVVNGHTNEKLNGEEIMNETK